MRILVTGAAGFIGSHCAERLRDLGHDVVGLDCFTDYYARGLKDLNAEEVRARGVPLHELDLAEDDLSQVVEGVEAVYHFAAQPGNSPRTPFESYVRNNLTATHRLVQAVKDLSTLRAFINISTSSVYGFHATDSEDTAPKPTSNYGVTKLAAEQLVLAYQRDRGFPACSLRLFSVIGERERPEKLYHKLIRSILEDAEMPLFEGSLEHSRSFSYVGDIVDGCIAVLDRFDRCVGEIFNLGSDIETKTARGIEIVEQLLGRKARFVHRPRRPGDQIRTCADIEKARRLLDYNPTTPPEEALRAEVHWYRDRVFGKVAL